MGTAKKSCTSSADRVFPLLPLDALTLLRVPEIMQTVGTLLN